MHLTLSLAAKGLGRTSPNPMVGAVVVKGGRIVGQGWHRRAGTAHAEVLALRQAGARAKGATLYVNLEPCGHTGRTPPCVEAVLASGVSRVVTAMTDPNPRTNGRSLARLRRAGVVVTNGVLKKEAQDLNEAFITWITQGRPHVTAKTAQTIDGRIAMAGGESQWITSSAARLDARRRRGAYDAILVGIGTVMADDPRLDAAGRGKQLFKIVLDSQLRISPRARLFAGTEPGQCIVVTSPAASKAKKAAVEKTGAQVLVVPAAPSGVDISRTIQELGRIGITSLLIEGGGRVIGQALAARVVDRMRVIIAPKIMGDDAARPSVAGHRVSALSDVCRLVDMAVSRLGPDVLLEGRVGYPGERI